MNKQEATELISAHLDRYYVYTIYLHNKPVYVGKGTKYRFKDHWGHKHEVKKSNKRWYNLLLRYRNNFTYSIEFCLDEESSFLHEKDTIESLGRLHIDTYGVLYNIAEGGHGGSTIDSTVYAKALEQYLRGYRCTLLSPYKNSYTNVECSCIEHGVFSKTPFDIKQAQHPCPECSKAKGNTAKLSTEEFVRRSKILNGDLFTYENTVYINSRSPITITCMKHGDIEVNPSGHLNRGTGCKLCKYGTRRDKPLSKKTVTKVAKFNLNGKLLVEYPSINLAVLGNDGTNSANISSCCRGKRKTHKGFIWKYN